MNLTPYKIDIIKITEEFNECHTQLNLINSKIAKLQTEAQILVDRISEARAKEHWLIDKIKEDTGEVPQSNDFIKIMNKNGSND